MRNLALYFLVVCLSAPAALGQNQSDIESLRARADVQERKIFQLEQELNRLKALLTQTPGMNGVAVSAQSANALPKGDIPGTYVVKQGDVLSLIARNHDTSVTRILEENALENDRIYVGQKLLIPNAAAPTKVKTGAQASSKTVGEHKVQSGDTFYSIARMHHVSVASLHAANPMVVPTRLSVGQILKIDGNARATASAATKSSAKASQKTVVETATDKSRTPDQPKATARESVSKAVKRGPEPEIRTITVDQQMTYGQFATKHKASTTQLNELNGLSLSKDTTLAKGSELYVPKF